jgi:hypothetical protein
VILPPLVFPGLINTKRLVGYKHSSLLIWSNHDKEKSFITSTLGLQRHGNEVTVKTRPAAYTVKLFTAVINPVL